MKKLQGWLIACSLAISALTGSIILSTNKTAMEVKADESDYEVYISGVGQSSGSLLSPGATVNGNSGSVTYTRDSSGDVTITFNNFKWSGNSICDTVGGNSVSHMVHVQAKGHNINVVVNGTNTINSTGVDNTTTINNLGVYFWCDNVTFTGSGSLTYTAGGNIKNANTGLYLSSVNNFTVDGPTLSFTGGTAGNDYDNGGDADGAYLSSVKFYLLNGSFTAKGGTAVSGTGGAPADGVAYGFYNRNGSMYLKGGSFTAIGGTCGTGSDAMSVGLQTDSYGWSTIEVSKTIEKFTVAASKNDDAKYLAIVGPITTGPVAYSWTNKDGTGTPTQYEKDKYNNFTKSSGIRRLYAEGSQVEYTATGYNGNYDGEAHTIGGITVTEPTGVDYTIKYGTTSGTYNLDEPPTRTDAGTTTVYFKLTVEGYDPIEDSVQIVVNKVNPIVTTAPIRASNCDFDGNSHALIQTAGVATGGTVQYSVDGGEYSSSIPSRTEAGSYAVSYRVKGDGNHKDISGVSLGTVTINKATITNYSVSVSQTYKYTGSPITPSVNAQATTVGGKAATFTYSKTSGSGYGSMPTFTDAGTYIVYYKVSAQSHNDAFGSFEFTIGKADAPVLSNDQKATAKTDLVYDGSVKNLVTAPTSPLTSSDGYTSLQYSYKESSSSEWSEWSATIPSETNANYYDVRFYYVGDSNHADTNPIIISNIHLDKAESTYDVVPEAVEGLYYDALEHALVTAGSSSTGTVMYKVGEGDYSSSVPVYTLVDDYSVSYYIAGDSNHYDSEVTTFVVKISENDKELLKSTIDDVDAYYDLIHSNHAEIAGELKEVIDAARAVRDNKNVTVAQIEEAINNLLIALSDARVKVVKEDISRIDKSILPTNECKAEIDEARSTYDDLTFEEKALISDEELKIIVDSEKAYAVAVLINNIGKVQYNDDSKKLIDDAREAYDKLTPDQQAIVGNYDQLLAAEKVYSDVDNAVKLIENIGTVEHTDECKDKIDDAREAYDKLTDEEKALVDGYNDSYKTLEDDEHVYEALVLIDEIGEVGYDHESEEKIQEAREYFDSLTEDQKEQLGEAPLNILIKAEADYDHAKQVATIWLIILFILGGLLIFGGIFFIILLLKRRKDDDDDEDDENANSTKQKPVKAMSVGGFLPFVILVSHWTDTKFIVLYAILGVAVLIWIAVLVIFILKKKGVIVIKAAPKAKEGTISKASAMSLSEAESGSGESATYTDEKGNIFQIRFIKSFTAKIIQANDQSKKYYEELKNEVLSYKGANSRVSWHYDSITANKQQVLKFVVRGKTLCVYFPLNADDYIDSKYKVEKTNLKKFEDVPCLYRIKNDRRCAYAKELIAEIAKKLGLTKGKVPSESYILPFEENKPLITRALIKEQKIQLKKSEEPVILEKKVNAEGDEIIVEKDAKGNIFEIRFIKSFTAKLSQSSDELKDYYNALKNHILSYEDVHSRVSWHYDAINIGREYIIKFAIRGKTLCVYFALNKDELDDKYKVEDAKGRKFEEVPCLYRIKNNRRFEYAKELIDLLMKKHSIAKGKELNDEYRIPYEETRVLLAKGLIKEVKSAVKKNDKEASIKHVDSVSAEEADLMMSDETAETMIEEDKNSKVHKGKRGIINLDDLEENFNDGDTITLEALIEKKLVAKDVGRVKLLARGKLDKKFHVDLQDYSIQAVKMVLLVGGTVQRAK